MPQGRKPGCQGLQHGHSRLDDGTSCRHESPRPGTVGIGEELQGLLSNMGATLSRWSSTAGNWISDGSDIAAGHAKSVLLSLLELVPFKQASPVSTALLKHYVERTGDPYVIEEIPAEWQDWMVAATRGRTGHYPDMNPYNSGLYDLRNSLGHFRLDVERNGDGTKTYSISDTYQFGYIRKDRAQRGRHGFPLGALSPGQVDMIRKLLPADVYPNPGGFKERWELKVLGKETILFILQQYLASHGKPFQVTASFAR